MERWGVLVGQSSCKEPRGREEEALRLPGPTKSSDDDAVLVQLLQLPNSYVYPHSYSFGIGFDSKPTRIRFYVFVVFLGLAMMIIK